ncbi:hypothetical protein Unana1_05006 [Umbelopsis nana]
MAANMIYSNGLPDDIYTQHVGKPIIVSSASPDWVEDDNVDEPDANTLYILLPLFDPGMFKRHGETIALNIMYHLTFQVLFLYMSEAMTMLDEGIALTGLLRKTFLQTLASRCTEKIVQWGLQDELEMARANLDSEWKRQAVPRVKHGLVDETFRTRKSEVATEVMETAEMALRLPGSEERRQ